MSIIENAKRSAQIGMASLTGLGGMTAAVGGLGALSAPKADAALMVSFDNYEAHKQLANNPAYKFSTAVEVTLPNGSKLVSSGVAIAPNIILTAAHAIPSATNSAVVSSITMGSNIFAPDAMIFSVASWERYSGYISGNKSTLDFGLVYLNQNIPGFTPVSFGSAAIGQTLTLVDYGNIAEQNGSTMSPTLGDRLAGYTPVVSNISTLGYPSSSYFNTFFESGLPSNSLNVLGIPGSSGGSYWNDDNQIVGIHNAQTNGFASGAAAALRTDNPVFLNYVNPRIEASWANIPEPSTSAALAIAALATTLRRKRKD